MTGAVLLDAWQDWECPNCHRTDRTRPVPNRFHDCPKLFGLTAPMVLAGTDCKVYAVEREAYLGREEQRRGDNGRPYMSVITERADGSNDTATFAAPAIARFE